MLLELESDVERRKSSCDSTIEGRGQLINLLKQTVLEEQLLSTDLKRKLQLLKKENTSLTHQLQQALSNTVSEYNITIIIVNYSIYLFTETT